MVPKFTDKEAVTTVGAKEKLTDEGNEEVQTESCPSQASKEFAASENVQVRKVLFEFVQKLFVENQQNTK